MFLNLRKMGRGKLKHWDRRDSWVWVSRLVVASKEQVVRQVTWVMRVPSGGMKQWARGVKGTLGVWVYAKRKSEEINV